MRQQYTLTCTHIRNETDHTQITYANKRRIDNKHISITIHLDQRPFHLSVYLHLPLDVASSSCMLLRLQPMATTTAD